ncbi:DUF603 domain-containing protein [Borrelia miyamotoi]|uniref:DUF603 domain-containing protein n=1 Tax=Borrelia miyamotoi TaxID=47466 RepID=A0AAQ2WXR4_9SPIR|nr:DUF603 domain-containing protein [Borrelia miyamotoi]AOW96136.1 hypothetical protein AXH25_05520 [Borrelia miyamotoi]QTL84230.1 DUF603 domain-containing protein [Borrelia miyamotoi]WAZ85879.1 DUF603 domain-containing protein [Borrelia miyamotoi]WAZ91661.1 DUF603 domain-containing protein [Borrelia miyamotoi]WAZ92952.1 DUF603 domain-containing protein [Borrelia miyamotoi]
MSRLKKTYNDYIVYFKEGRLKDAEIAKELGVSRVNVGKMRRKWKSLKDESNYVTSTSKLTISEDTFNNMLARSLETETHANRLKNQVEIEKNNIALTFLSSFNKYCQLELQDDVKQADKLHNEILQCRKDITNADSNDSFSLNLKISELKELEKKIETKKMDLCYKVLLKLKSVIDITKYKE